MRQRMGFAAIGAALLLGVAACGGGSDADDDASDEDVVEAPAVTDGVAAGADDADAGDADADPSDGDVGDDILADFLEGSGLTTDIVSDEQHECMNAELRPLYPDGFPENLTEEDVDAVDAAADACGVTL